MWLASPLLLLFQVVLLHIARLPLVRDDVKLAD
jgi:hypothetical protein